MEDMDYKISSLPRGLNPFLFQLSTLLSHASTQVNSSDLH